MKHPLLAATAAAILVGGCSLVPPRPEIEPPVSDTWRQAHQGVSNIVARSEMESGADIAWRDFFTDPGLQRLIEISLENNRDLRIAALRAEQTRALYRIQRSALYPDIVAGAGVARRRFAADVSPGGDAYTATSYEVSASAAWELDLFGRVRSLNEAALERYLSTEAARDAVQTSLIASVASQYLTFLQLKAVLQLSRETLKAVEQSYELNRRSFLAGAASELDLRTSEGQVQTARVNVSTYEELLVQAENALVLLIGQPIPEDLLDGGSLLEQALITDIPAGLPSDLLRRRPDIIAAEHALRAANADIGVARAAFFPTILLTGSGGTASASLGDLFTGPSMTWSFAPQITVPIFQGGRNRAGLDAARIARSIEIANYERAIQTAFREVADALALRAIVDERIEAQRLLVEAQQRRYDLTEARYRQGVDSYVAVLLAQQDLYAAQRDLLQFQAARLVNSVTLYRALGGGWDRAPSASEVARASGP